MSICFYYNVILVSSIHSCIHSFNVTCMYTCTCHVYKVHVCDIKNFIVHVLLLLQADGSLKGVRISGVRVCVCVYMYVC